MHRDVAKRDDRHALTVRDELNRAAVNVVHGALLQRQASPRSPRRSTDAARHAKETIPHVVISKGTKRSTRGRPSVILMVTGAPLPTVYHRREKSKQKAFVSNSRPHPYTASPV